MESIDENKLSQFLINLQIHNPNATVNLIQGGFNSVEKLRQNAPTNRSLLTSFGFTEDEEKVILKELEKNDDNEKEERDGFEEKDNNNEKSGVATPVKSLGNSGLTRSGAHRKIAIGARPPEPIWVWRTDDKQWQPFDKETTYEIEQSYSLKKESCKLTKGFFGGKNYVIQFTTMRQKNIDTGNERRVKRQLGVKAKKSPKIHSDPSAEFEDLCTKAFERKIKEFGEMIPFFSVNDLKVWRNSREQTVLYCAALGGSVEITKKLINMSLPVANPQGPKKSTPLHAASWKGHAEVVAILLLHGADPQLKNEMGLTAEAEAQGATKLVWEVFKTEGLEGVKKIIPKPNVTLNISLKNCIEFPLQRNKAGSASTVDTILTLTCLNENDNFKIGCWKYSSQVNNRNFDISPQAECISIKLFEIEAVKMTVDLIQHVEMDINSQNGIVTQIGLKKVASSDLVINLQEESEDRQHKLNMTPEGCILNLNMNVKFFDDELMKEWLVKQSKTPGNINENILNQFYAKMKDSFTEFRTLQLKENVKMNVKAAIKKKLHITTDTEPYPLSNSNSNSPELGLFYPTIYLSEFSRSWEHLDYKNKIKHYLGFHVYSQPLYQFNRQHKPNLTWNEFLEQHVFTANFIPIMEELSGKYSLQSVSMLLFCTTLMKHISKSIY